MSLPYHSERVEEAGRRFDETVPPVRGHNTTQGGDLQGV